jgi:diadenosine tetraphosphate (Ap4A) HIT family hydrolase
MKRHLQVEDDQVVLVLQVQRRHLARVGGAVHLLVAAGLEQEVEQLHVHRLVVDDQDARAADIGWRNHGTVLSAAARRASTPSMASLNLSMSIGLVM